MQFPNTRQCSTPGRKGQSIVAVRIAQTVALSVAVVTLLCAGCRTRGSAQSHREESLNFLVVGDWGDLNHNKDQRDVAQAMAEVAEKVPISFIVSTGDNFYFETKQPTPGEPPFEVFFETVYTNASLRKLPWYLTLGNHDYAPKDYHQAEIAYTTSANNTDGRWIMLSNYFAITNLQASALLVFLDTTPIAEPRTPTGQAPEAQLTWLKKTLEVSTNQWKLVFGHHPILQMDEASGRTPCRPVPGGMSKIDKLLMENNTCAYFCGHVHALEYLLDSDKQGKKLHCFISGGGGSNLSKVDCPRTSEDNWAIGQHGFALVSLQPEKMVVTFWSSAGKSVASVVVNK